MLGGESAQSHIYGYAPASNGGWSKQDGVAALKFIRTRISACLAESYPTALIYYLASILLSSKVADLCRPTGHPPPWTKVAVESLNQPRATGSMQWVI